MKAIQAIKDKIAELEYKADRPSEFGHWECSQYKSNIEILKWVLGW